jgi:hypothetical protein
MSSIPCRRPSPITSGTPRRCGLACLNLIHPGEVGITGLVVLNFSRMLVVY